MSDLAYLAVVIIFGFLSWGLMALCKQLMGEHR